MSPLDYSVFLCYLEELKELIERMEERERCYVRDHFQRETVLHNAASSNNGRVDLDKELLEGCSESTEGMIAMAKRGACLHIAVRPFSVNWVSQRTPDSACGNTLLHLATSTKQLQSLKGFTSDPTIRNLVDVNAINSRRFTSLNSLDVLPHSGKIDMEIDRILRGAGALRARDFPSYDASNLALHACTDTIKCTSSFRRQIAYCVLLVTATMLAAITYLAAFSAPAVGTFKTSYTHYRYNMKNGNLQLRKSDSIITRSFIMFNSMGFISSVAMIIFLLREFPLKPWPQISISAMFGSYMCLIMAISPDEALPLLLLAIPFLLLAAAGKMFGFAREKFLT